MKFFTPELIRRGQSHEIDVLNEQERLWEEAGERYAAYLDSVRPLFPSGLKHIDDSYYLHDAVIRGMGRHGQFFVIILQLDTPPQSILTFKYDLIEEPTIVKDALPEQLRESGVMVDWQYDEIELVPGTPPTWRQSILMSNGWELVLHFRDVQSEEVQAVLPSPRHAAPEGASLIAQHATHG